MMADYLAGNDQAVAARIGKEVGDPGQSDGSAAGSGDEIMWRLEAGTMDFLQHRDARSIAQFDRAEALMTDFDQRAVVNLRGVGAESAVLVTNPNALPYRGWSRDRLMLPVFRGLAYLGKNDEAGFRTELFRLRENQQKVMDEYRSQFQAEAEALEREKNNHRDAGRNADPDRILAAAQNREVREGVAAARAAAGNGPGELLNPLAIFLSGYGYCRDRDWENALVDFARLHQVLPGNRWVESYYAALLRQAGRPVPPELEKAPPPEFALGGDSLLVIFADGRSAALRQGVLYIPIVLPDYYVTLVSVAWPVCEYYPLPYQTLQVKVDGKAFATVPLADMNSILSREYDLRLPGMIARIALSTAVKEAGAYALARSVGKDNEWVMVATSLGAAAYKVAVNTADTRGWELLPAQFQVIQLPMPADRKVELAPDGAHPVTVELPGKAKSAMIYVNAPSNAPAAFSYRIFSMEGHR